MSEERPDLKHSIAAPLFDLDEPGHFTCITGYTNARYVPFTDAAKHIYEQIFGILSHFGIEYYVFAGSLVGYVRDGRMPAWMDDIDLMIFEKDIRLFEERAAPYMLECGFNCKVVGKHYAGGGYHILALQQSGRRDDVIAFSKDKAVSVPWAQIDVFFSTVDEQNYVRNLKKWGLYHNKNVPVDWVSPPQTIEMNGMRFETFADIEADVHQEYGDVLNTLVVQTHNKVFLRAEYCPWSIFAEEFDRIVKATVSPLPPGLTQARYAAYRPITGQCFEAPKEASFDDIASSIIAGNAAAVNLTEGDQIYWVMDLKRLFPDLHITVEIASLIAAKRAAHLQTFIDAVEAQGPDLERRYHTMVAALEAALGETVPRPVRKMGDVL